MLELEQGLMLERMHGTADVDGMHARMGCTHGSVRTDTWEARMDKLEQCCRPEARMDARPECKHVTLLASGRFRPRLLPAAAELLRLLAA